LPGVANLEYSKSLCDHTVWAVWT